MRYGSSIAYCWKKGKVVGCLWSFTIMWLFACFPGSRRGARSKRCRKNSARTGENNRTTKREGRVLRKKQASQESTVFWCLPSLQSDPRHLFLEYNEHFMPIIRFSGSFQTDVSSDKIVQIIGRLLRHSTSWRLLYKIQSYM